MFSFIDLSIKVGIDKIAKVAKDFGLGQIYPLNLPKSKKGIIPSKKWKKENLDESWYAWRNLE